jgi:redox-sensitive bicupin YhaK (pirin superfamily)
MKISIRKSNARGQADHGWLKSQFSFSFADYYDPEHMGFRCLRVINEDWIAPGGGFPTHPHWDMEIFTVLVQGTLEHKDSMGNGRQLKPGQIQLMSAGSGVTHSEFNPSTDEPAHLLQIWILPRTKNLTPSYTEWQPSSDQPAESKILIISGDGRDGAATIHQSADIYRLTLSPGESVSHTVAPGRAVWIQCIQGSARCEDTPMERGDAVYTEDEGRLTLTASSPLDALLFDLP